MLPAQSSVLLPSWQQVAEAEERLHQRLVVAVVEVAAVQHLEAAVTEQQRQFPPWARQEVEAVAFLHHLPVAQRDMSSCAHPTAPKMTCKQHRTAEKVSASMTTPAFHQHPPLGIPHQPIWPVEEEAEHHHWVQVEVEAVRQQQQQQVVVEVVLLPLHYHHHHYHLHLHCPPVPPGTLCDGHQTIPQNFSQPHCILDM